MDKKLILSRISRDGKQAIVRGEKGFRTIDLSTREFSSDAESLGALIASGSWRRPTSRDTKEFTPLVHAVVAAADVGDISMPLEEVAEPEIQPEHVYDFNQDYDFYASPYEDMTEEVDGVYALDPDTGDLYFWQNGEFTPVTEQELDPSLPDRWILVDNETAQYVAKWSDNHPEGDVFCIVSDANPEEKAMFASAEAAVDWDFIRELGAVVADASGYTPQERARNAQKQRRGPGGRFAPHPGQDINQNEKQNDEVRAPKIKKTYLPSKRDIVLIDNPLNFLTEAIGKMSPTTGPAIGGGVVASGEEQIVSQEAQDATREKEVAPSPDAVYFAIVDRDDSKSVLNLIAITKTEAGAPQAWNRNNGEWKVSPEVLADLQSITPPPVVQLNEDEVEGVMEGIDSYDSRDDSGEVQENDEEVSVASIREDIAKGYALHDGTFRIKSVEDLFTAIKKAPEDARDDVKAHIVKRARAFNRMDVVPEQWRSISTLSQLPLFNSYGEVIIASGNRGGNEETLKDYWENGAGSAKIRWGSEGDLSRCHRHLTKYIGSQDAWGFCQNLHMKKYGKSNYKRDNG